jgi:hypothetical protein
MNDMIKYQTKAQPLEKNHITKSNLNQNLSIPVLFSNLLQTPSIIFYFEIQR